LTPTLPGGLRRVGSDLIPWDGGTAAADLLVTPGGDELVLLTAETPTPGLEAPEAERADGVTTVSWRLGRHAYALSGDVPATDLLRLARTMAPGG
jgi:anti-sigma factor RsiW